jgi:hypothetical protein
VRSAKLPVLALAFLLVATGTGLGCGGSDAVTFPSDAGADVTVPGDAGAADAAASSDAAPEWMPAHVGTFRKSRRSR